MPTAVPDEAPSKRVRLVVDYGDGVEKHFTRIAWKQGLTILDAMNAAARHPRGLKFTRRGSGRTAFLVGIDGLKNEGARGGGRNWQYWVNGDYGREGFGVKKLRPSDVTVWKFKKYDPRDERDE